MAPDKETIDILRSAMSAQAALKSMGFGMNQSEEDDFAREMEARDAALAAKRANAATGGLVGERKAEQRSIPPRRGRGKIKTQPSIADAAIVPSQADADVIDSGMPVSSSVETVRNMVSRAEETFMERAKLEVESESEAAKAVASGWTMKDGWDAVDGAKTDPGQQGIDDTPYIPHTAQVDAGHREPAQERPVPGQYTGTGTVSTPDFMAFSEITGWPTDGLAYENRIYGQSLKLVDMFILAYIDDNNGPEMLDTLIGRHVRGIDPGEILSADELYLLHWLRAASYPLSGMYGPKYVCDHCKYDVAKGDDPKYTIGFNDLVFTPRTDPGTVIRRHMANGYVTTSTWDGRECHIYLRRRRHDREISDAKKQWVQEHSMPFPKYYGMPITTAAVVEIEGCDGILDKMHYICEYPTSKRKEFMDAITDASLSTTVTARITCPNCGGVVERPYPFRVKDFLSGL